MKEFSMADIGYAVVLMMCWAERPCQMVAIRPQSYADLAKCEQAANDTLMRWQKARPEGADLKTTCRTTKELCNLVTKHESPLRIPVAAEPDQRFTPTAISNRLMRALHLLCNEPRPGGCGDGNKV